MSKTPLHKQTWWLELEKQFYQETEEIRRYWLETYEEALNKTTPVMREAKIVHPNVMRFQKTQDHEHRACVFDAANNWIAVLERKFKNQELDSEFLRAWGKFSYCYGYLQSILFAEADDLRAERGARKGSDKVKVSAQLHWVSKMLVIAIDGDKVERQTAELKLAELIRNLLDKNGRLPKGLSKSWFKKILTKGPKAQLKKTYISGGHLPEKKMREFASSHTNNIPMISWNIKEILSPKS